MSKVVSNRGEVVDFADIRLKASLEAAVVPTQTITPARRNVLDPAAFGMGLATPSTISTDASTPSKGKK